MDFFKLLKEKATQEAVVVEQIPHHNKGRKNSPEEIAKSKATNAANRLNPDYVNPLKGRKQTPEQIASALAARAANKAKRIAEGNWVHPLKGRKNSPETIAKKSASMKAANKAKKLAEGKA